MTDDRSLTRRDALKLGLGAGALLSLNRLDAFALSSVSTLAPLPLIERAIPSTGERVPVIGIGTARSYEAPTPAEMPVLKEVLRQFPELGGKVLDTAPAYGRAEEVVGDALAELKNRDRYFLATKVSISRGGGGDAAAAAAQMKASLQRLKTNRIDLMQIWNVSNPAVIVPVLNEWKASKKIRYTGITSSSKQQYDQLEDSMKKHKVDFVQVDLAIDNRSAQERIIPTAVDHGMGVLVNLPLGRTRVFQRVLNKPLPDWAKDMDATSWAQIFLKYILSNPAVTCVIPGTATTEFLVDNNLAARGRLPDAALRKRIESYFDAIA
ncbi:MAG TPA: aldo/keto reductase [Gemmatimonadaceae bacterium]|jgi:aryl-alcohol dehydrogenase-like predicted oxidoreductase